MMTEHINSYKVRSRTEIKLGGEDEKNNYNISIANK